MTAVVPFAQTSTDTPTPTITVTPGPSPTPTVTLTSTIDPQSVYLYGTLQADGQPVAIVYTYTAGEVAITATNLVLIILVMFIVFLLLKGQVKR
jgi:hypothetical protein